MTREQIIAHASYMSFETTPLPCTPEVVAVLTEECQEQGRIQVVLQLQQSALEARLTKWEQLHNRDDLIAEVKRLQIEVERLQGEVEYLEDRLPEGGYGPPYHVLEADHDRLEEENAELREQIEHLKTECTDFVGSRSFGRDKSFHREGCRWAKEIPPCNLIRFKSHEHAVRSGYKPCKTCRS